MSLVWFDRGGIEVTAEVLHKRRGCGLYVRDCTLQRYAMKLQCSYPAANQIPSYSLRMFSPEQHLSMAHHQLRLSGA